MRTQPIQALAEPVVSPNTILLQPGLNYWCYKEQHPNEVQSLSSLTHRTGAGAGTSS